jgi:hypothetical protein
MIARRRWSHAKRAAASRQGAGRYRTNDTGPPASSGGDGGGSSMRSSFCAGRNRPPPASWFGMFVFDPLHYLALIGTKPNASIRPLLIGPTRAFSIYAICGGAIIAASASSSGSCCRWRRSQGGDLRRCRSDRLGRSARRGQADRIGWIERRPGSIRRYPHLPDQRDDDVGGRCGPHSGRAA